MGTWAGEQGFVDLPLRQVFATGLAADAAAMIIAHNHPSGDPTPGPEALRPTRDLARIGAMLGIRLVDHLVLAGARLTTLTALRPIYSTQNFPKLTLFGSISISVIQVIVPTHD